MVRIVCTGVMLLALAACSVLGPPSINLSRSDIAERAFADRGSGAFGKVFKGLESLPISGPDVGFQVQAQRIELAWTLQLAQGPLGVPISLRLSISGQPVLNPQKNGIDLADTRIEEIRLPGLPFINLDRRRLPVEGAVLGTVSLLQFRPDELNRDGVIYEPSGLELGTFGLRVALAPK
jgi:hypothetical protein